MTKGWGEQHDDHCFVAVTGLAWKITHVTKGMIWVARDDMLIGIDIRRIDWPHYCDKAARILDGYYD